MFSIDDLHVVITGAANGIGAQLLDGLLARCAKVTAWDREELTSLDQIADGFGPANARADFESVVVDLRDPAAVANAADHAQRSAEIDVLINCAGVTAQRRPALETPLDEWNRAMDVNFFGTLHTCLAVGRHMVARGSGAVINFSSVNAVDPSPGIAHYCVSKAAVSALTSNLALEWASHKVRVNAIGPGPIVTATTEALLAENADLRARWESGVPMGRLGQPRDLFGMVVYLASPASSWVTGCTYFVDGGWLL